VYSPAVRRLTNAFSKEIENDVHSLAVFTTYCNFVREHKTLRIIPGEGSWHRGSASGYCRYREGG
jgi:hypothetical protein